MQLTDQERAALADRIAALIALRTQRSPIDRALEIIDTVLETTRPEPAADAIERAALIDELAEEMWNSQFDDDEFHPTFCDQSDAYTEPLRQYAEACLPIIDRLLTTRPEPAADAVERAAEAIAEMYPPRRNKRDGYINPVWDMVDIEDVARAALAAAVEPEGESDATD